MSYLICELQRFIVWIWKHGISNNINCAGTKKALKSFINELKVKFIIKMCYFTTKQFAYN